MCNAINSFLYAFEEKKHFDSMTLLTGCWWILSVEFCAWSMTQAVCRPVVGVGGGCLVPAHLGGRDFGRLHLDCKSVTLGDYL